MAILGFLRKKKRVVVTETAPSTADIKSVDYGTSTNERVGGTTTITVTTPQTTTSTRSGGGGGGSSTSTTVTNVGTTPSGVYPVTKATTPQQVQEQQQAKAGLTQVQKAQVIQQRTKFVPRVKQFAERNIIARGSSGRVNVFASVEKPFLRAGETVAKPFTKRLERTNPNSILLKEVPVGGGNFAKSVFFLQPIETTAQVYSRVGTEAGVQIAGVTKAVPGGKQVTATTFKVFSGRNKVTQGIATTVTKNIDNIRSISTTKGAIVKTGVKFPSAKPISKLSTKIKGVDISFTKGVGSNKYIQASAGVGKTGKALTKSISLAGIQQTKNYLGFIGRTASTKGRINFAGVIKKVPSVEPTVSFKPFKATASDLTLLKLTKFQTQPALASTQKAIAKTVSPVVKAYQKGRLATPSTNKLAGVTALLPRSKAQPSLPKTPSVSLQQTKPTVTIPQNVIRTTPAQPKEKEIVVPKVSQLPKAGQGSRARIRQTPAQKQVPLSAQTPKQVPAQKQPQKPRLGIKTISTQILKSSPRFAPVFPTIFKPQPLRPIGLFTKVKSVPSKRGFYTVSIRRRGKFITVGKGLSLGKAFEVGKSKIQTGIGATFKVSSPKGSVEGLGTPKGFYSKKGGLFVEERKYRLNTGGELQEIKLR